MALSPQIAKNFWKSVFSSKSSSSDFEDLILPKFIVNDQYVQERDLYMKNKFNETELDLFYRLKREELSKELENLKKFKKKKISKKIVLSQNFKIPKKKDPFINKYKLYLTEIKDLKDWTSLSCTPKDFHFSNISSLKVIIDTKSFSFNGRKKNENVFVDKLYLINSHFFKFHYEFYKYIVFNEHMMNVRKNNKVRKSVNEENVIELTKFNEVQYKLRERRFILCTITRYSDQNLFCLTLWPDDTLENDQIIKYYKIINEKCYFNLKFRPISNVHIKNISKIKPSPIPIVKDLFSNIKYQPLVTGIAYGKLQFFSSSSKSFNFDVSDIVICETLPLDVTPVSAIITNVLQSPLCHVALLMSNRKTPNMSLIGSFKMKEVVKLKGKWVKLVIGRKNYSISKSNENEYNVWKENVVNKKKVKIIINPPSKEEKIVSFCDYKELSNVDYKTMVNAIGAKAAVLCEIKSMDNLNLKIKKLDGFAIPFAVFLKYLLTLTNRKEMKGIEICKLMKKKPFMDKIVIESVYSLLKQFNTYNESLKTITVIFRSSTNVEDIKDFNGAGLYDSLKVEISEKNYFQEISKVITNVYCSLYTKRAVEERKFFNVDETNMAMAILVQPYIKATVNGVALSCNPMGKNYPTFFINAQKGMLVTDSRGEDIPEQWLLHEVGDKLPSMELVSRSSVLKEEGLGNDVLLDDKVLARLHKMIMKLHIKFNSRFKRYVDIEFLVEKKIVYILQCRPYSGDTGNHYND